MKLLLTIQEYKNKLPIYDFQIPDYLSQVLGMTQNEYYQAGMYATQRLIDAYMQNYLLNKQWDISMLDYKLQEKIKDILFLQFQYMHENQLFFEKTSDITYSTAGQQTFTFNPSFNEDDNFPLIPKTVKRMIVNTGILQSASGKFKTDDARSVFENEFKDGFFVPDVKWSDKADNVVSVDGNNYTMSSIIMDLYNNKVSKTDQEYLNSIEITNSFKKDNQIITVSNNLIRLSNFYENKQDNDLAQIKDLKDLWSGINQQTQNNSNKINDLTSGLIALNEAKVSLADFNQQLGTKVNLNLSNVNVGSSSSVRYVQVDTNGQIKFTTTSGDLKVSEWKNDVTYLEGEAVFIKQANDNNTALIYIATNLPNNVNKNPLTTSNYWVRYNIDLDLNNYLTQENANNLYLSLNGANQMKANLDMGGRDVVNANNLLTKDDINDELLSYITLWSSGKVNSEINKVKSMIQNVVFENSEATLSSLTIKAGDNWLGQFDLYGLGRFGDVNLFFSHGMSQMSEHYKGSRIVFLKNKIDQEYDPQNFKWFGLHPKFNGNSVELKLDFSDHYNGGGRTLYYLPHDRDSLVTYSFMTEKITEAIIKTRLFNLTKNDLKWYTTTWLGTNTSNYIYTYYIKINLKALGINEDWENELIIKSGYRGIKGVYYAKPIAHGISDDPDYWLFELKIPSKGDSYNDVINAQGTEIKIRSTERYNNVSNI